MIDTVTCFGASSDIAAATLTELAPRRALLAGRDLDRIQHLARHLRTLGTETHSIYYDATSDLGPRMVLETATLTLGDIDLIIDFTGTLNPDEAHHTNYQAGIRLIDQATQLLTNQGHGHLVILSTVAAVRPRTQNVAYAASKAGLDAYARTIAHKVHPAVHVMVVRPGHVHTRMTAGLPAAPFAVTTRHVATAIRHGLETRRRIVWVPSWLGLVMAGLRIVPDRIWARLDTGRTR